MDDDTEPEKQPETAPGDRADERDIPHEDDLQEPAGDNVVTGDDGAGSAGVLGRPTRIN